MSGLEVIGSVASVLQLAGTVYSISKTLYEVGDALSNAPSDIKDLARDLETFSEELHLLSGLLDDKTHRYSDRVYRLTAKIIGDCASICVKIDRILKKLRSKSFLARVKWVFKEKEIMKLLGRLRDLKLSLMGMLSLLSALKADHMMDVMGVGNPSLLVGPKDEQLSKETAEEVEQIRRKLVGISTGQAPEKSLSAAVSGTTLVPSVTQSSVKTQRSLDPPEKEVEPPNTSPALLSSATSFQCATQSRFTAALREVEVPHVLPLISTMALPNANAFTQIPQAMESVQSFYSVFSTYDVDDSGLAGLPLDTIQHPQSTESSSTYTTNEIPEPTESTLSSGSHYQPKREQPYTCPKVQSVTEILSPSKPDKKSLAKYTAGTLADRSCNRQSIQIPILDRDTEFEWRAEMVETAMKRFKMNRAAAESWASILPFPDLNNLEIEKNSEKSEEQSLSPFKRLFPFTPVDGSPSNPSSLYPQWDFTRDESDFSPPQLDFSTPIVRSPRTGFNVEHQNPVLNTPMTGSQHPSRFPDGRTRDTLPGHWISDGDYSDDSDYVVKRRVARGSTSSDEGSHIQHPKRHLVEDALSGTGVAALLGNSNTRFGTILSRGGKAIGGAALGAIDGQALTGSRTRSRRPLDGSSQSRSRGSSRSTGWNYRIERWDSTGVDLELGMVQCGTEPIYNHQTTGDYHSPTTASSTKSRGESPEQRGERGSRSVSMTRSSRLIHYSDDDSLSRSKDQYSDAKHRVAQIAKAGAATAAVAGVVKHFSVKESRSRSGSPHFRAEVKTALDLAASGIAAAAATKYAQNRKDTAERVERGRSRTRSASRNRDSSLERPMHFTEDDEYENMMDVVRRFNPESVEGGSYRTVQGYRVTPSQGYDDRRPPRMELLVAERIQTAAYEREQDPLLERNSARPLERRGKRPWESDWEDRETDIKLGKRAECHEEPYELERHSRTVSLKKERRAGRPKIKMGCNNCKRRRVKCDETKPQCQKCVRSGLRCNGYLAYKRVDALPIAIALRDGAPNSQASSSGSPQSLSTTSSLPPTSRAIVVQRSLRAVHECRPTPPPMPRAHNSPPAFLHYFHHYVPYQIRRLIFEQEVNKPSFNMDYLKENKFLLGVKGDSEGGGMKKLGEMPFYEQESVGGALSPDSDANSENSADEHVHVPVIEGSTGNDEQVCRTIRDDLSCNDLYEDLWLRAFTQLQAEDHHKGRTFQASTSAQAPENCRSLYKAWTAAYEGAPVSQGASHDLVARITATRLASNVGWARMQLLEAPTEMSRSTVRSIDRFDEILKVMQETLKFKTGAFVWTCLCSAEQKLLENRAVDQILANSELLKELAEIATLVARYNVMESMYQQWPGMTLEANYEKSLIALSVEVLKYLDLLLDVASLSERIPFEGMLENFMVNVRDADIACRGFNVTIVNEDEMGGVLRAAKDVSDEDEDSDSTETREEADGGMAELLPTYLSIQGS